MMIYRYEKISLHIQILKLKPDVHKSIENKLKHKKLEGLKFRYFQ